MSKHTPGPWFIWKDKAMQLEGLEPAEIHDELISYSEMGRDIEIMAGEPEEISRSRIVGCDEIVVLGTYFKDSEEVLANARLIAAAPDLLEALQEMLQGIEEECHEPSCAECLPWRKARAAIAKATGEQA